ncbi:DUF2085 domain-containing protein [Bacillus sp. ISL-18]|uniref:DUF2085 domain-containing protein n=1 Tax=Bacillus sp. ISL-18 TaxID=2819118 RepID=UPI001BECE6F3|nr:DUF2085 domain-containing protein [Bacillus sp. ISL-18]MBT2657393.1 DUF2085 domain-containing protein [Bacillus sp. ISL-18]
MIQAIFDFFGRAICHQLDERSLHVSGLALSVCARDTGIYIGIFSTLLYLHIFKRKSKLTIPTIKISFLLLLLMIPLMIDGLGSYTHLFQSNNVRRLVSGICFGFVLPYFLYPLFLGRSLDQSSEPVIQKRMDLWVPFLGSSILGGLFYFGILPYYLLDSFIIFTIIVWFSLCASFLIPFVKQTYYKGVISIILSLFFLSCLSLLHAWLVQFL